MKKRTKLADWLFSQADVSPADLQRQLGITDRSVFFRYLTGERRPRKGMAERIKTVTKGKVRRESFDGEPPKCAVVIIGPTGKRGVVLPWSTRDMRLEAAFKVGLQEPPEGEGLGEVAKRVLMIHGGRAKYLGGDRFMYDNRPTDLRRLVQMANEMLVMLAIQPIEYPGAHPKQRPARILRHAWGLFGFAKRKKGDSVN